MDWISRLNRNSGTVLIEGTHLEVLHWAYSASLADNVPHRHTFFELCLVGGYGSGTFTMAGEPFAIAPGDIFFARPGVEHRIQNSRAPGDERDLPSQAERMHGMELFWVCFEWIGTAFNTAAPTPGSEVAGLFASLSDSRLAVCRDDGTVRGLWNALRSLACGGERAGSQAQISALQTALLVALAQAGAGPGLEIMPAVVKPAGTQPSQLAVRYIHDNLNRPLGVEEVAVHVHLSRRHLNRLFQADTGLTPSAYIEAARLQRARHLLLNSERSLKAIAAMTGYADVHYFSRVFAERCGLPPGAFRRRGASLPMPEPRSGDFA